MYTIINRDLDLGRTYIKTDTDTVPYKQPYFCRAYFDLDLNREIEYSVVNKGCAAIQYDRKLKQLNWDLNSEGQLVVIGEDAMNYGINEKGELIYNAEQSGIGSMSIEDTFIIG